MRELTGMEVEAVAGRLFDFGNVNIQPNNWLAGWRAIGGINVFGGKAGDAGVGQLLGQTGLASPKSPMPAHSSAAPGGVRV